MIHIEVGMRMMRAHVQELWKGYFQLDLWRTSGGFSLGAWNIDRRRAFEPEVVGMTEVIVGLGALLWGPLRTFVGDIAFCKGC